MAAVAADRFVRRLADSLADKWQVSTHVSPELCRSTDSSSISRADRDFLEYPGPRTIARGDFIQPRSSVLDALQSVQPLRTLRKDPENDLRGHNAPQRGQRRSKAAHL
jgi:hypothetical protein